MLNNKVKVKVVKAKVFREEKHFALRNMVLFGLVFAALGGFFVWRSLAAETLVASVEAETLSLSGGASVFTATKTTSGKAVYLPVASSASGNVNLPTAATKVTISARGKICSGTPKMVVRIDDNRVMSQTVSQNSWTTFSTNLSLNTGMHKLSIKYVGETGGSCLNKLFVDKVSFYGEVAKPTPVPTVAFSASPNTINAGQSSTLTWTSTNATSCTAGGAWSGDKPLSGSISSGALNADTTYKLTCQGPGGNSTANASVSVTAPASVIPANYRLLHRATKVSDWDSVLIELFNGTITDTPQGIRYWVSGPANKPGGRVETQLQRSIAAEIPSDGGVAIYRWKVMIPEYVELTRDDKDGHFTISQNHGNNQAGYTGGVGINWDNSLSAKFEGGKRLDANNYESEIELPFGKITRGKFHEITMHVRWEEAQLDQNPNGFAILYLDGVKGAEIYNVPTMGPQADNVMMRVGWYSPIVSNTGFEMFVKDYEVWIPQ